VGLVLPLGKIFPGAFFIFNETTKMAYFNESFLEFFSDLRKNNKKECLPSCCKGLKAKEGTKAVKVAKKDDC